MFFHKPSPKLSEQILVVSKSVLVVRV